MTPFTLADHLLLVINYNLKWFLYCPLVFHEQFCPRDFVHMFASCNLDGTSPISNVPSSSFSLPEWYCAFMCFVHAWNTRSFYILITLWLSHDLTIMGPGMLISNSSKKLLHHIPLLCLIKLYTLIMRKMQPL